MENQSEQYAVAFKKTFQRYHLERFLVKPDLILSVHFVTSNLGILGFFMFRYRKTKDTQWFQINSHKLRGSPLPGAFESGEVSSYDFILFCVCPCCCLLVISKGNTKINQSKQQSMAFKLIVQRWDLDRLFVKTDLNRVCTT